MDILRQTDKLGKVELELSEPVFQPPRLVLVLGGARSGKSTFAERLAASTGLRVTYIATAQPIDAEIRTRIARHRASRPLTWSTIEEPLNLEQAIRQAAVEADVLLVDCLTLWLSNWFDNRGIEEWTNVVMNDQIEAVIAVTDQLMQTIASLPAAKTVIMVSNEIGFGMVPMHPLGRAYRDALGWINQRLARDAARVYMMFAGVPVDLKRLQEEAKL